MGSFDIHLETPDEWRTAPWAHGSVRVLEVEGIEELCSVVSGILTDGTNLHILVWPDGQRALRCSPHTGWAIEERYTGTPLDSKPLEQLWRHILDDARRGLNAAIEQNGGRRPGA